MFSISTTAASRCSRPLRSPARGRSISSELTSSCDLAGQCAGSGGHEGRSPVWKTRFLRTRASWLALRRLLLAPDHASGCPTLRPASANQPLGPLWPATEALCSTWCRARAAWPRPARVVVVVVVVGSIYQIPNTEHMAYRLVRTLVYTRGVGIRETVWVGVWFGKSTLMPATVKSMLNLRGPGI